MSPFLDAVKGWMGGKKPEEDHPNPSTLDKKTGKAYLGSLCRVLNFDNICYFVGRIEDYDPSCNEIKLSAYRSDQILSTTEYSAPVKLQILSGDQVILLYAHVKRQSQSFWWVHPINVVEREDQRDGFRQVLSGTAYVMPMDGKEEEKVPCQLVDISLTGICFRCEQEFQVFDRIVLTNVALYPKAPHSYTLPCIIYRTFTRESDTHKTLSRHPFIYYGCAFQRLSQEEKENLFKDIFLLQQMERRSEME